MTDTLLIRVDSGRPGLPHGKQDLLRRPRERGLHRSCCKVGDPAAVTATCPRVRYTTKLFTKGAAKIAQKVGEEAVETVIEAVANNNPDLVYEASDLIYHLLVLLENQGLSIADLEEELAKRHK